ncbi:hypothetical protein LguiB_011559 [Lonicera macranthoides]
MFGPDLIGDIVGLSDVLEADANQIATVARETFEKDGPLLVVASGRDTIPVASSIKRLAPENVFVVQIQHPRSQLDRFDLVIAPRHDYYPLSPQAQQQIPWFLRRWITPREPPDRHVVLTVGALHQADSIALQNAAFAWHNELAPLKKPLLVVNVGGPTINGARIGVLGHECTPFGVSALNLWYVGVVHELGNSRNTGASGWKRIPRISSKDPALSSLACVVVYPQELPKALQIWSRPCKATNHIIEECSSKLWEPQNIFLQKNSTQDPNPHMGHLAWADAFLITADSVSMLSEACSTGKPVYVIGAEQCTWKFADFQKSLQERGAVRPFTGNENISKKWEYPPLNDTAEAAGQVIEALAIRGWRLLQRH